MVSLQALAAAPAQQDERIETVDVYIQERMAALGAPGAAVAVVRDGEVVHLAGYGVANPAGDPVTPQTPFLLASLSKSMTAVAVLQLVEQGLVELDAPIQTYLPWFMPATPITVRQLLNQTSGLDELDGYERNLDPGGPDGLEQSIRRLAETELNRPPGSAFEYSNSNADTLGLLIQTVTGQPYGDTMAANVFAPLGMTGATTSLADARAAGMSRAADTAGHCRPSWAGQEATARTTMKAESSHVARPATAGRSIAAPSRMSTASTWLPQRRARKSPVAATATASTSPTSAGSQW